MPEMNGASFPQFLQASGGADGSNSFRAADLKLKLSRATVTAAGTVGLERPAAWSAVVVPSTGEPPQVRWPHPGRIAVFTAVMMEFSMWLIHRLTKPIGKDVRC